MNTKPIHHRLFVWFCLLAAGLLACSAVAAEIKVFAAASLTDALRELGPAYEQKTGNLVTFNLAGSSTLARQIEAGAPADVFFSADEAQMDRLARQNLIKTESRRTLLGNSLVIVVSTNQPIALATARDLAGPSIRRLALADPKIVPAGVYARQWLERQKIWEAIESRVVPTENVRAALAAVEAGNAEAGIVYRTDVAISRKVRIAFAVPVEETPGIGYPVAVLRDAPEAAAAAKWVEYLESPAAKAVFERYGFTVRAGKPVSPP